MEYTILGYSFWEMQLRFMDATREINITKLPQDLSRKRTQILIAKLKVRLYDQVENFVYDLLQKETLPQPNGTAIKERTIDWLKNHSTEVKNYLHDSDNTSRIINYVVLECSLAFFIKDHLKLIMIGISIGCVRNLSAKISGLYLCNLGDFSVYRIR